MNTLGERLAYARNAKGLTQKDLAKIVGTDQSTIANTEIRQAKGSTLAVQLAIALEIEPLWLATGKGPMESPGDLSADEQHLLHDYRDNDEEGQAGIRNHARLGRLAQERKDTPGQGLTDKVA